MWKSSFFFWQCFSQLSPATLRRQIISVFCPFLLAKFKILKPNMKVGMDTDLTIKSPTFHRNQNSEILGLFCFSLQVETMGWDLQNPGTKKQKLEVLCLSWHKTQERHRPLLDHLVDPKLSINGSLESLYCHFLCVKRRCLFFVFFK